MGLHIGYKCKCQQNLIVGFYPVILKLVAGRAIRSFLLGSVVIFTVIPAKAGIQRPLAANAYLPATGFWVPAFAGMTETDARRPIFLN